MRSKRTIIRCFANNIYAKGFLQIYARFLNVDVSDFSRTLDNANPISVSDYQYLSNAPTPRREVTRVERDERKPPSLAPLFFFVIIILLGVGAFWIVTKYRQITGDEAAKGSHPTEAIVSAPATPQPVAATPAPVPAPVACPSCHSASGSGFRPGRASHSCGATAATIATGLALYQRRPDSRAGNPSRRHPAGGHSRHASQQRSGGHRHAGPGGQSRPPVGHRHSGPGFRAGARGAGPVLPRTSDQDFVTPTAVSSTDPAARPAPASGVNEVLVATTKRTWVTVRKDDPKGPPIFSDYVYPSANPLKLKGARFFIDTPDPNSVQITKNGLPYAYQAPNIPVQ
ncbi:hypothetical protein CfE428DRAFT_2153 [Chthoniobacter flavus Ellin428]|uniref:DUF4115 domain-containing protein n=1 Tax=Chthoniobacter flavus Ellin428 TaxID=497964 RepID=B4CZR5_9BACT|nr:hypothetical protein [Chthoniobacter flavus]EDY20229.1 hypothetical protein CfE428DRAFT_2153 [Chthoniobacter flavus Ellin428]